MDNIKQVVKDIRYLIATDCNDETIQARIENYIEEQSLKAGQHETIVMWRKPDEELPTDGQEVLFVQGNDILRGYFSKPRSFFGPSGYNVNGVNGNHQIDKWVPVSELL